MRELKGRSVPNLLAVVSQAWKRAGLTPQWGLVDQSLLLEPRLSSGLGGRGDLQVKPPILAALILDFCSLGCGSRVVGVWS